MISRRAGVLLPVLLVALLHAAETKPPARYEWIEITYKLMGGATLTETRTGQIHLNDTPALAAVSGVLVPLLNAAGRADLRDLAIVRSDGSIVPCRSGEPRPSRTSLFWEVPDVRAGDEIRFSVEQTVDLEGSPPGAWWFSRSTAVPLPARKGSVGLQVPRDFAGSVVSLSTERYTSSAAVHAWRIDGAAAPTQVAYFAISSFRNEAELAQWIATVCPAEPGVAVRELAHSLGAHMTEPGSRARFLSDALSHRLRVRTSAETLVRGQCRAPEAVLGDGSATPLEAQAVLFALYRAAGIAAGRALSTGALPRQVTANPRAFTRAWVRVKSERGWLWFDASRLAGASGVPSTLGQHQRVLLLEAGAWTDLAAGVVPETGTGVSARLDASILANGTLQGTLRLTGTGAPSQPYREAFQPRLDGGEAPKLWSPFLEERRLRSGPVATDPYDSIHPFELKLPARESRFVPPVRQRASLALNLVPLTPEPKPFPSGRWWIGAAGTYTEEINLHAPAFRVEADAHSAEEREFARFRSDAVSENGDLHITRTLEVLSPVIEEKAKTDLERLWRTIRADQERSFSFRRVSRAGVQDWVDSLRADEAQEMGLRALDDREFEAARLLFQRATAVNPKDEYAWNNLGRALLSLGRPAEARKAFEKQIEANPKDIYAYNNLGRVDLREGHWAQARDRFRKQLEAHPGDRYATLNLPHALSALGDWAEAEVAWAKAAKIAGENPLYRVEEVVAKTCQGKVADAAGELVAVWGASPHPIVLNNAAYVLAKCGKELALAEDYAGRAVEQVEAMVRRGDGRFATAFGHQDMLGAHLDTLGWVLWKKGEVERAAPVLAAAAALYPTGDILAHLAMVQWKLGQNDEALRSWHEALLLMPGLSSEVPRGLEARINAVTPRTVDGVWHPVTVGTVPFSSEEPAFFVVFANPDGTVRNARPLDLTDPASRDLVPVIGKLVLPPVATTNGPIPTVHVIKARKAADGTAAVYRSNSYSAIAIAAEMAPEEFAARKQPPPQEDEQ